MFVEGSPWSPEPGPREKSTAGSARPGRREEQGSTEEEMSPKTGEGKAREGCAGGVLGCARRPGQS